MREHLILYKNMIINHMDAGPICFKSIARWAHHRLKLTRYSILLRARARINSRISLHSSSVKLASYISIIISISLYVITNFILGTFNI